MKPLHGVRVLDLTQLLSGPYATQILADLGAEVIKIEQPGGDKARGNGPLIDGHSTYFASVNRGKKSLALNLKNDWGRQIFSELVRHSAVVVENYRPGVADRLGIGFDVLREWNPAITYAACSGFGHSDSQPRPALDIIIQAIAGTMSLTGEPGGPPLRSGFSAGDIGAGLYLAIAILAALVPESNERHATYIDISMLDTQVALLENAFARFFGTHEVPHANGSRHPVLAPFQCFAAKDGRFVVATSTQAHWMKFTRVVGKPGLYNESMFLTAAERVRNIEQLEGILDPIFIERSRDEWIRLFEEAGVPVGRVNTVSDAAEDPNLLAREMFSEVQFGSTRLKVVGSPLHINGGSMAAEPVVAEFNANQVEVLGSLLNMSSAQIERFRQEGAFE